VWPGSAVQVVWKLIGTFLGFVECKRGEALSGGCRPNASFHDQVAVLSCFSQLHSGGTWREVCPFMSQFSSFLLISIRFPYMVWLLLLDIPVCTGRILTDPQRKLNFFFNWND
jgi:hypothetical protein